MSLSSSPPFSCSSSSSPTSFSSLEGDFGIIEAVSYGYFKGLKEKRDEIGDDGKFRRMCDSEIDNDDGCNVLHFVAGAGDLEWCKFLVEEVGVDIHVQTFTGETPLLAAVKNGHVLIVEYLIERGSDIMRTDHKGFTTLHYALEHAFEHALEQVNKEILIMLLKKGADIEADSVCGKPLHYAVCLGIADNVKFLLENNAEPNSVTKYQSLTPLTSALYSTTNNAECVELLLKAGADPNMSTRGLSPLTHAVEAYANNCIDALLAAGADVDSVSFCGLRPIDHAVVYGNLEAIWILILARPRLMATSNWSLAQARVNSKNDEEASKKTEIYWRNFKQSGNDAWDKQDYSSAIESYNGAFRYDTRDDELLANRSLCWACMGEVGFALNDADLCVNLKPDWGKAHLRAAAAWHIHKMYRMSSDNFKRAFELDPKNEEIDR